MIKSISPTQKVIRASALLFILMLGFSFQARTQSQLTISNKTNCPIKAIVHYCQGGAPSHTVPANSEITTPNLPDIKFVEIVFPNSGQPNITVISQSNPCGSAFNDLYQHPHPCMIGWVRSEQPWQGGTWLSISVW